MSDMIAIECGKESCSQEGHYASLYKCASTGKVVIRGGLPTLSNPDPVYTARKVGAGTRHETIILDDPFLHLRMRRNTLYSKPHVGWLRPYFENPK